MHIYIDKKGVVQKNRKKGKLSEKAEENKKREG